MTDDFIDLFAPSTEGVQMQKLNRRAIQLVDEIKDGLAGEAITLTTFSDCGITLQEVQKISFTDDGQPTDPNYPFGKCHQGHLVLKQNLAICDCGVPVCPKDRIVIDGLRYCKKCGTIKKVGNFFKVFFRFIFDLLLVPFKE